jgi:putative SOS response-associated peptidase YedK
MCGLYSFKRSAEETRSLFAYLEEPDFPPRTYVTPGGPIAVVRSERGERHFTLVRWGFIPSWKKELEPGRPLINARGETAAEKPTFRNAFKRRRCLVPADGYYEWQGDIPGKKQAYYIHKPDDSLFAFAGLWETWMGVDGSEIDTAAIVTIGPNAETGRIHTRMPVVIATEDFDIWLRDDLHPPEEANGLIRPAPDGTFLVEPTKIERRSPPPPQLSLL